jgi:hypothetical protein
MQEVALETTETAARGIDVADALTGRASSAYGLVGW